MRRAKGKAFLLQQPVFYKGNGDHSPLFIARDRKAVVGYLSVRDVQSTQKTPSSDVITCSVHKTGLANVRFVDRAWFTPPFAFLFLGSQAAKTCSEIIMLGISVTQPIHKS